MEAERIVDSLYEFRDRYFESHPVTRAARREDDLVAKLQETLPTLNKFLGIFGLFSCDYFRIILLQTLIMLRSRREQVECEA